ncbi:MAG: DNA-formamidopyrimidine glycosylase family protein [Spirochaetaceae bacterium]|nr:DNA-formamidopyrimidine glycosylase family protein [Spirochaetaceae bacterium]
MPELPDLVHIVDVLAPELRLARVARARVKDPIVLRVLLPGSFDSLIEGRAFQDLERHGPFLRFGLSSRGGDDPLDLVMHLMLAGRLRLSGAGSKNLPYTAFVLELEDGRELAYADEKSMGKVYLGAAGRFEAIPGYLAQGVDITGPLFTFDNFERLIAKRRHQARVFVMDQSALSAIGNAYADEILFEAGIHPKTPCTALDPEKRRALYDAILRTVAWGIDEVSKAGRPSEEKVRGHMRVRGRAGQACPRCGSVIRKAGVLGYDAFFCPACQPDVAGRGFVDWRKLPPGVI